MDNTAHKIDDLNPGALSYFKSRMYQKAIESWNDALQENALDGDAVLEIEEAKKWFANIQEEEKNKKVVLEQLNALDALYHIRFIESFRAEKDHKLTPAADILIDKEGRILIADEFNHRIQIYDKERKEVASLGKKGNAEGEFYYPKALSFDSKGNLYVADCWNHRIQKFSPDLQFIYSFGSYGEEKGQFNEPYDIAADKDNRIFVVDRCNHRIQVFDFEGRFLNVFGQRGTVLEEDLAEFYETPTELFSKPAFEFPTKIALDSKERIYIADSGNFRVQVLSPQGKYLSSFGERGEGQGQFEYPFDIAIDSHDNIFITDPISSRIQQFTPQGMFVLSLKGSGEDVESSLLTSPYAITLAPEGKLMVTEDLGTEITVFQRLGKELENIYQKKILLVPEKAAVHSSLADFYCEERRWNEAAEEFILALSSEKKLDTEMKLVRCLLRPDFSQDYFYCLDKIGTFSVQSEDSISNEILRLCKEKNQIKKDWLSHRVEKEWKLVTRQNSDEEMNLEMESKNRKINGDIRKRLIQFKKAVAGRIEYVSLLFELYDRNDYSGKKEAILEKTALYFKEDLTSITKYLEKADSTEIIPFLNVKKENFTNISKFILNPEFKAFISNDDNWGKCLIDIYLDLNKKLLAFLRERREIYFKIEKGLNSASSSGTDFEKWSSLKRLYEDLNSTNSLIGFLNSFIAEVTIISSTSLSEKMKMAYKKSLQSLLPMIEEANWLLWENALFMGRNEYCMTGSNSEEISFAQDQAFEKIIESERGKSNIFDTAVAVNNKISLLLKSEVFDFNDFMDIINKAMTSLKTISQQYQRQYESSIEEYAGLEFQIKSSGNLPTYEMTRLQNALETKIISKNLNRYSFFLAKKTIISLWQKIATVLKEALDSKKEEGELMNVESWLNKMWHAERENIYRKEAEQKPSQNSKDFEKTDVYQGETRTKEAVLENYYQNMTQIFVTLRNQIVEKTLEIRTYKGDIKIEGKNQLALKRNLIEYDMSFGKLGSAQGEFYYPTCIKKDIDGNLLISDQLNHRIQKFSIDGEFISSFGDSDSLKRGLNSPVGLAVDREGSIYVVNMSGHRIDKFSHKGKFILSFGKYGSGKGEFNQPTYIAINSNQEIFVSDRMNKRIQKFSLDGEFLISFEKKEDPNKTLHDPAGIYIDKNGDILVGDHTHGLIYKMNSKGEHILTLGRTGIREDESNSCLCFAQDEKGNVYVSDHINHRIQKFTKDFEFISCFGTSGKKEDELNTPVGLEIIKNYLFVCDHSNHRIQKFSVL